MYHENGGRAWEGPTGYYYEDWRSLPDPDQSKTWDTFYFWAKPEYNQETMYLSLKSHELYPPPPEREYLLELLVVPDGVVGAPEVGTVWELPLGSEVFTLGFPTFKTENGLEGYKFSFTITEAFGDGDCDFDDDVDLQDFLAFQACFTGPGGPVDPGCECVDFDADGDVDLLDFFAFQTAFTGPG